MSHHDPTHAQICVYIYESIKIDTCIHNKGNILNVEWFYSNIEMPNYFLGHGNVIKDRIVTKVSLLESLGFSEYFIIERL